MIDRKKVILSLVMLTTIVASITMIVGNVGGLLGVHAQKAAANSVTSTDFSVPAGADPWGTAFDSQGRVWVALPGCDIGSCSSAFPGKIARFDPTTQTWTGTYPLPSGYGQPLFLAFDHQGNLWFTMPISNSIGEFNIATNTMTQHTVPTASSGPWGITVDGNGLVWFTEHYINKIGSFNPTNNKFTEIATPAANSIPYGITVDASNNVWFTENNPAAPAVDEYPSGGGQLKVFPIPAPDKTNVTPHLITIDGKGNIWWSEGFIGAIGKLDVTLAQPGTSKGITRYQYTRSGPSHTSGIGVDSNGQIWFDDSLQSFYGSYSAGGSNTFSIYSTPSTNSHPHDGLNVDKQNRVWFDEEFANKLALAIQSGGSATPTPGTSPTSTPVVGQVLAKDTFQRANQAHWGNASDGHTWGGDANTVSAFSVSNNAGVITNAGNNNYSAVLGSSVADAEVLVSGSLSNYASANIGAVLRWTDGNDWYKAYIDGGTFYLQKKVAGTGTILVSKAFTAQANTSYTIRFQAFGSTLNAKVWATGSAEPTNWMLTTNDTSFATGYAGIRALSQTGTATFTSFQSNALTSGGTTPTATVGTTPTAIPTTGTTPTVTPTTPTSGQTLGADTFQRANQAHWGNASDGHAWGGDSTNVNAFAITNNTGTVVNGGNTSYSAVLGSSATNADVLVSGSLSSFANANFGAVLRWTDGNDWYKAYIDGGAFYLQKKVAGTSTILTSVPFAAQANTSYTIRFDVTGSTLNAKVWATSSAEPSAWTLTTNDTSLTAGTCGIRVLTQAGTATFTSFKATSL